MIGPVEVDAVWVENGLRFEIGARLTERARSGQCAVTGFRICPVDCASLPVHAQHGESRVCIAYKEMHAQLGRWMLRCIGGAMEAERVDEARVHVPSQERQTLRALFALDRSPLRRAESLAVVRIATSIRDRSEAAHAESRERLQAAYERLEPVLQVMGGEREENGAARHAAAPPDLQRP